MELLTNRFLAAPRRPPKIHFPGPGSLLPLLAVGIDGLANHGRIRSGGRRSSHAGMREARVSREACPGPSSICWALGRGRGWSGLRVWGVETPDGQQMRPIAGDVRHSAGQCGLGRVGDDDVRRFERLFRVAERIAPEARDAIEQARSTLLGMRGRSIGSALVLDQRTCPV